MARKVTKQKIKYLKDQGLQVTLPTPDERENDNKRTIIVQKIIKQKGANFDCNQLVGCPIIVDIQGDINTIEGNISTINTAITNLQNATTVEAMQDAVAPLLVHGNHIGLTATYNDVGNEIILNVHGSATKITQGTNVTITGTGTIADPYVINSTGGGTGDGGIVYSLSNGTLVVSTTGNRGLASTGTGANKTYETSQTIDPATGNTINQTFGPGGTVTFNDTDVNLDENSSLTNLGDTILTDLDVTGDTVFEGDVIFNGTISGAGAVGADEKLQATRTTIGQVIPLTTKPRSGIKSIQITAVGGVIQISPTDYTYNPTTNEITMLVAPGVSTTIEIQYPIKDSLVALPADTLQVTQTAHGFVALDWIRYDEGTATWVKAQANSASGLGSWHVVSVINANTFLISKDGTHTILNSLTPGEYVLSDTTAGGYTQTLPTTGSSYILYGMEVINSNTVNFYTVVGVNVAATSGLYGGIYSRFWMFS